MSRMLAVETSASFGGFSLEMVPNDTHGVPVHRANQITPFTCGLACLEGISHELGAPITQAQLLIRFRKPLYDHVISSEPGIGIFGSAKNGLLQYIWGKLGFDGTWLPGPAPAIFRDQILKPLKTTERVLISCHYENNQYHTFRYAGIVNESSIHTIFPSFGEFYQDATDVPVSFQHLVDWNYSYAVLSRKVVG